MQPGLGLRLNRPGLPTATGYGDTNRTQAYGIPGVALLHTGDTRQTRPVLSASTPPAHDLRDGPVRHRLRLPLGLAPTPPCAPDPVPDKDTSRALLVLFTLASNQFLPNAEGTHS